MLEIGNSPTEVRRQKALLKTGALQNAIFNSANFSSIATDAKGVIQIFNVGAQRMLGYTAAEVMNKITPADISDPQEMIARAKALSVELGTPITPGFEALVFKAARGIEDIYELTYIRKDGSRFPAVVSVTALRDDHNEIIGYLLIGTDNTARQQAEAERREAHLALRDREEKLAITLNSIGDAVIATDANAHITLMNPVAEHLTGWTQQQALGRSVSDVFHIINKGSRQAVTIPVMAALAHGTVQSLANHTVLIALDGSECDIADSCAPIRDRDDAVIGAVLVFRDVTRDYAAQQALRDGSALIQTILNTVVDGIITLQAHHGVIETINPAAERMFGYQAKELIGQRFSLLIPELGRNPPHLLHGTFDDYRASEAERMVGKGREVLGLRKDGSTFPMEMAVSEMQLGGQRYFTGILRDVTARQRIETERARLAQALQEKNAELESAKSVAEKANLAKSDFLSSMSHELRTPLHAILGFAQLMESSAPPPTSSQKTSIDQILQAGWYLLELINEILDIALIESGRLSISPEPMSLAAVLSDCQAMIEPQAQKRGIHVSFPPSDGTCFVKADRTRVKQVFINLLSNAIKYNRPGGTVEVTCHAVADERIRISFRDSGAGLSAENLPQLFQPFNRLGQEASGEEGTGIGLVVSKQLVELMGGTIGAQSIVGVGSMFWIELNATPAPQLASHATPATEPGTGATSLVEAPRWTLLCVEDNPANLMLVEQLLARRSDIRLLSAHNGSLGIEMARSFRPDVILMDLHLPGINGISALRILANDPTTAHIPVIALSANAMQRDVQKGLAAGFFRYLTKPIKVNEFMDTLDAALTLASRRATSPATPPPPPATSAEVSA